MNADPISVGLRLRVRRAWRTTTQARTYVEAEHVGFVNFDE